MIWKKCWLLPLVLLTACFPFRLFGQVQFIKANFINTTNSNYIWLDENSYLEWGEVSENEIFIYRLESGENGYLDMQINDIDALSGFMRLQEDGGSQNFTLHFNNRQVSYDSDPTDYQLQQGDFLRIQRCDAQVKYFHNEQEMGSVAIIDNNFPLYAHFQVIQADVTSNGNTPFLWVKFPWVTSDCPNPPDRKIYAHLQKQLDGTYTIVRDGKLRFTYVEDYAISANINDQLFYEVYDGNYQALNPAMTGSFTKAYGINWETLAVDQLPNQSYYILEIKGINKNETHYLRFKCE